MFALFSRRADKLVQRQSIVAYRSSQNCILFLMAFLFAVPAVASDPTPLPCDLNVASVTIASNVLMCGGNAPIAIPPPAYVEVSTTSATANQLIIQNSEVVVILSHVLTTGPLVIEGSTVSLIFSDTNEFTPIDPNDEQTDQTERSDPAPFAAIACNGRSNVTFSTPGDGGLLAQGIGHAPGIGPSGNDLCHRLTFLNGTYDVAGWGRGAGIGSGVTEEDSRSILTELLIVDGDFQVAGGYTRGYEPDDGRNDGASAIGTSAAWANSESSVGSIVIYGDPSFALFPGYRGAGIGTGSASGEGARTGCDSIVVANGAFDIDLDADTTGIGSGFAGDKGENRIGSIRIENGSFTIGAVTGAAGIGTGRVDGSSAASLESLVIDDGFFHIYGESEFSGIGSGYVSSGSVSRIGSLDIIDGSFQISAASECSSGIGTGYVSEDSTANISTVHIENGSFSIATDGHYGAGIGTGSLYGRAAANIRLLHIENGSFDIRAHGQVSPGIGAGDASDGSVARIDTLRIDNGSFTIACDVGGAGIGISDAWAESRTAIGTILIADGNFDIAVVSHAPAIGSGVGQEDSACTVNDIVIENGDFDLRTGSRAATIGSGTGMESGTSSVNSILISNGSFRLTGGQDAGALGAGRAQVDSAAHVGTIRIEGGSFTIKGGLRGPGIGSGRAMDGSTSSVDAIVIAGGSFDITGGEFSTGIGAGYAGTDSTSSVDSIVIDAGSITIHGDRNCSGIGVSQHDPGSKSTVKAIFINGGSVNVTGAVALGSIDGSVGSISIGGSSEVRVECLSVDSSECLHVPSVAFGPHPVHFEVGNPQLLNYSDFAMSPECELLVEYRVPFDGEGLVGLPLLYLQGFTGIVGSVAIHIVRTEPGDASAGREIVFDTAAFAGFMVNVQPSNYFVTASGSRLCSSLSSIFHVDNAEAFYDNLAICGTATPAQSPEPTLPFTSSWGSGFVRPPLMLIFDFFIAIHD
jgi:hypothetical protein